MAGGGNLSGELSVRRSMDFLSIRDQGNWRGNHFNEEKQKNKK